jgi:hypothetical protein
LLPNFCHSEYFKTNQFSLPKKSSKQINFQRPKKKSSKSQFLCKHPNSPITSFNLQNWKFKNRKSAMKRKISRKFLIFICFEHFYRHSGSDVWWHFWKWQFFVVKIEAYYVFNWNWKVLTIFFCKNFAILRWRRISRDDYTLASF